MISQMWKHLLNYGQGEDVEMNGRWENDLGKGCGLAA